MITQGGGSFTSSVQRATPDFVLSRSHRYERAGEKVTPQAGDILHVTREASVQFLRPMMFRVIRVHDWPTYEGWVWLDGYQLNAAGDAVERRSIFVQVNGLQQGSTGAPVRHRAAV